MRALEQLIWVREKTFWKLPDRPFRRSAPTMPEREYVGQGALVLQYDSGQMITGAFVPWKKSELLWVPIGENNLELLKPGLELALRGFAAVSGDEVLAKDTEIDLSGWGVGFGCDIEKSNDLTRFVYKLPQDYSGFELTWGCLVMGTFARVYMLAQEYGQYRLQMERSDLEALKQTRYKFDFGALDKQLGLLDNGQLWEVGKICALYVLLKAVAKQETSGIELGEW